MAYLLFKRILSLLGVKGKRGRPKGSVNKDTVPAAATGPMDRFAKPKATRTTVALDAAAKVSGVVVAPPASSSDTSATGPPPSPPPTAGGSGIRKKPVRGRY